MKIRNKIKNIFYFLLALYSSFKIIRLIKRNNEKLVYVLDIDNTLADTFHCYKYSFASYNDRLSNLAIFLGMRLKYLKILEQNNNVFFISARRISSKETTLNWLLNNGININKQNVFSINNVKVKINILKFLRYFTKTKIIFIDDLSYNHENGKVKYYKNQINELSRLNINHINSEKINEINNINKF